MAKYKRTQPSFAATGYNMNRDIQEQQLKNADAANSKNKSDNFWNTIKQLSSIGSMFIPGALPAMLAVGGANVAADIAGERSERRFLKETDSKWMQGTQKKYKNQFDNTFDRALNSMASTAAVGFRNSLFGDKAPIEFGDLTGGGKSLFDTDALKQTMAYNLLQNPFQNERE